MPNLARLEEKVAAEEIFHKPMNDGFVALNPDGVNLVRDRDGFEFVHVRAENVISLVASEADAYPEDRFSGEGDAERVTGGTPPYTDLEIHLSNRTYRVTLEEGPETVAESLIDLDY